MASNLPSTRARGSNPPIQGLHPQKATNSTHQPRVAMLFPQHRANCLGRCRAAFVRICSEPWTLGFSNFGFALALMLSDCQCIPGKKTLPKPVDGPVGWFIGVAFLGKPTFEFRSRMRGSQIAQMLLLNGTPRRPRQVKPLPPGRKIHSGFVLNNPACCVGAFLRYSYCFFLCVCVC